MARAQFQFLKGRKVNGLGNGWTHNLGCKMKEAKAIPVFRIFDVQKAKEFYLDWLGFKIDWEHRFEKDLPLYIQVSRGSLIIHLTEHHGDCSPGAKAFVETQNLEEYHKELTSKEYNYNRPDLEDAPWNALCMDVTDPFNNKILFSQSKK